MTEETKYKLQDLQSLTKVLAQSFETQDVKIYARDVANIMELINERLRNILGTF